MWQTPIDIPKSDQQFSHTDKIFSIGSCFADEIGQRLSDDYFDIKINPFGILYNPVSISKAFKLISGKDAWEDNEVFFHQNKWRHYDFHSRVSRSDKADFIQNTNTIISESTQFLRETSLVIITLGTAFVWEKHNGQIVGNCHKIPSNQFKRRMLSTQEITDALNEIKKYITSVNPNCQVILTVSPVRHLRDGLVDNSWSKSRLIDACRTSCQDATHIDYFPSYEIVIDELRDYRFYKRDKLHVSEEAVDYIYGRFFDRNFNKVPQELMQLISRFTKLKKHRKQNAQVVMNDEISNKKMLIIDEIMSKFDLKID